MKYLKYFSWWRCFNSAFTSISGNPVAFITDEESIVSSPARNRGFK